MAKVLEETKSKEAADLARTTLETEIDNLTSSLFTEANKMVATERIARARAEEKMKSLEERSSDMAGILDGLQGTLREKVELLDMTEKESSELKRRLGLSEPATDAVESGSSAALFSDGDQVISQTPTTLTASPRVPHSLAPLSLPRLLTSVPPYHEFLAFIAYLRQLRISVLAPPLIDNPGAAMANRGFAVNAFANTTANYTRDTTANPLSSPAQLLAPHLPLSSHLAQPFLKRCVEEDSDPSLRLDLAPGLGFLSRRTVGTAIVDGTLLIEPTHAGSNLPSATCSLCGVALEKWWGSEIIVATPKPMNQTVNSTMKKVLGAGGWSIASFTGSSKRTDTLPPLPPTDSTPATPPSQSTESLATTITPKTPAVETPFVFPTPSNESIHIFRLNDTSASRYAICPTYCLTRLRAVCEFWNYVRVIERGLLLEEGFKFVRNGNVSNLSPGPGSTSSVNLNASAGRRTEKTASVESLAEVVTEKKVEEEKVEEEKVEAAGLETMIEGEATPAPAEEPKDEQKETKSDDEKVEPKEVPTDAPKEDAPKEVEEEITAVDVTNQYNTRPPVTVTSPNLSSSARPPVPKRSIARSVPSPVLGSSPFPSRPVSPVARDSAAGLKSSAPITSNGPPRPPPRHPLRHGLARSALNSTLDEAADVPSTGWEDRCWSEVVKLKENVFWGRIGAAGIAGSGRLMGVMPDVDGAGGGAQW